MTVRIRPRPARPTDRYRLPRTRRGLVPPEGPALPA